MGSLDLHTSRLQSDIAEAEQTIGKLEEKILKQQRLIEGARLAIAEIERNGMKRKVG